MGPCRRRGPPAPFKQTTKTPAALAGQHLLHRKSRGPGRDGVGSQTRQVAFLVHLEGCSDDNSGCERRDYVGDRAKSDGEWEFSYYLYLNCISDRTLNRDRIL